MWWTKPRNIFKNGGDQIFSPICPRDQILWKSRQVWTETINSGYDGIDIGCKKLIHGLENLVIPYPSEPGTFTNWRDKNRIKSHPRIDLPTKLGILAQFLATIRK